MATSLLRGGLLFVAALAVVFQLYLKDPIWLGLGIGKVFQPLSDFPHTCRKIVHPEMEACEDMWLSESTRQLFLTCSDPLSRNEWMPNVAKLNVSARSLKDSIVRLQIDDPLEGGGFKLQTMNLDGFTGTSGDGLLSVGGFTGFEDPDTGLVTLFVVNNRPSVDSESGELLDQLSIGANATVDVFRTTPNDQDLEFVRTYSDQHIATPNRVAALSATSFYVTNDHGKNKLGVGHHLSPFIGTGDVTFCSEESGCAIAAEGLHFPNGLTLGRDGLIYVPSSMFGTIDVFKPAPNKRLQRVDQIKTGFAIDNVSADKNGVLFVAAFPRGLAVLEAYNDPWNYRAPSAGLRIQKSEDGSYTLDKAIEDGFGEVLPAATTVVHDVRTGRLFFSSVISPWIGVCEPNAK